MVMVVAMGFRAEVSGVAVGWWRGHGFRFGCVLCGGGGSRWLQIWVFVFIWVLIYIILLCKFIILMSRIEK